MDFVILMFVALMYDLVKLTWPILLGLGGLEVFLILAAQNEWIFKEGWAGSFALYLPLVILTVYVLIVLNIIFSRW